MLRTVMPVTVRHVLFYVPLKPGNLMLAEMEDGSLRVLKNDEIVEDYRWEAADMGKAVEAFQELKARYVGRSAADGASDSTGHSQQN